MDMFSKFTISHFIWYLVPGLGLIFFFLFPVLAFSPHTAKVILSTVGPLGILILGVIAGFFLDGLRLYRFRPRYSQIRKDFFKQLKDVIGKDLNPYLIQSVISDVARSKEVSGLSMHHAIWIMLGHFSVICLIEGLFWLLYSVYVQYFGKLNNTLFGFKVTDNYLISICAFIGLIFILIGFRFKYISIDDQESTNNMFINFEINYSDEIKDRLGI